MTRFNSRRHSAYSLVEIMLVISILAVLLGMMMYRHSYTLTRSSFNQDVELFVGNMKEMGTSAKRLGILMPVSILDEAHVKKGTNVPSDTIRDSYMLWVIKEKKTSTSNVIVTASGLICNRSKVNVGISNELTNAKSTKIEAGVWMDIYSLDDPDRMKTMKYEYSDCDSGPDGSSLVARILYEPNQLPHKPGIIVISLPDDKSGSIRSQRIDIERSGVITVNTEGKDKRLND